MKNDLTYSVTGAVSKFRGCRQGMSCFLDLQDPYAETTIECHVDGDRLHGMTIKSGTSQDFVVDLHHHPTDEFIAVVGGDGTMKLRVGDPSIAQNGAGRFKDVVLKAGDRYRIPAFAAHSVRLIGDVSAVVTFHPPLVWEEIPLSEAQKPGGEGG